MLLKRSQTVVLKTIRRCYSLTSSDIERRAVEFRALWNESVIPFHRALQTDGSISSFAVYDKVLAPLQDIGSQRWGSAERFFFNGAACDIATVVANSWRQFSAANAITLSSTLLGVEVSDSTSGNRLPIISSLFGLFRNTRDETEPESDNGSVASSLNLDAFGIQACIGLSPFGLGSWATMRPLDREYNELLLTRTRALLPTIADSYSRLYSRLLSTCSQSAPEQPHFWSNFLPALSASSADGAAYLLRQRVPPADLLNMAKLPVSTVANAATAALAAQLNTENELDAMQPFAELCYALPNPHALRQTVNQLRSAHEIGGSETTKHDWRVTGDAERYAVEKRLNLLPLMFVDTTIAFDRTYRTLIDVLVSANSEAASKAMDETFGTSVKSVPSLLFQRAALYKISGNFRAAIDTFETLRQQHERFVFNTPEVLLEYGDALLRSTAPYVREDRQETQLACDLLRAAVSLDREEAPSRTTRGRAAGALANALLVLKQYEDVIELLEQTLYRRSDNGHNKAAAPKGAVDFPASLRMLYAEALLLKGAAERGTAQLADAREYIVEALQYVPFERKALRYIMMFLLDVARGTNQAEAPQKLQQSAREAAEKYETLPRAQGGFEEFRTD